MSIKALSLFMSLIMIFSVCAPLVSAVETDADKGALHYVSVGDSMTNGYCFEGYHQNSNDRNVYDIMTGLGMYGKGAYPLQFEEHLRNQGYDVTHTKLATSAMTAEDLLYLLGGREYFDDGWNGYKDYVGTYTDEELSPYFIEAVKTADIMTLCVGNAAFGAYLIDRIASIMGVFGAEYGEEDQVTLDDALMLLESEELKKMVLDTYDDLKKEVEPYLSAVGEDKAEFLLNQVAYTVASFLVNYDLLLDRIVELNPDVEVILVGLFNTMEGFEITGEDFSLPFGEWMTRVYAAMNAYIAAIPMMKQAVGEENYVNTRFWFAEQPEPEYIFEAFDDLAAADWANVDGGRLSAETIRDRTIGSYADSIAPMIAGAFGMPASWMDITLEDVKRFEANETKAWANIDSWAGIDAENLGSLDALAPYGLEMPGTVFMPTAENVKTLSVMIYLAIEQGIIQSADTSVFPVAELLKLVGPDGLSVVFDNIDVSELYGMANIDYNGLIGNMYATGFSPESIAAFNETVAATREDMDAEKILAYFTSVFTAEELKPLCKIFALFKVGNGMSVHPTPAGHDNIADSVIKAYEENHTVFKESVKNLKILGGIFMKYYKEIYAYVYAEAKNKGVIDDINTYIDEAVKAIDCAEAWAYEYEEYFRSEEFALQIAKSAAEAKNTAEALRALINDAEALDETTYANALALLAQMERNAGDLAALINVAAKDAADYADPIVAQAMEEMKRALAFLNVKMHELLEAAKKIEAVVLEQIAAAEALCQEFIAVAEKYLACLYGKKDEIEAYLDALIKAFLDNDAFSADYRVSADSYYLAIGDDLLYAELLSAKMGLGKDQFATMAWDSLDSSIIAKADLITVGYSESRISGFAADQIFGYVKNYVDTELRDSVGTYAEAALRHFFANMTPALKEAFVEEILAKADGAVNDIFDEVLKDEIWTDAELVEMDWAELVGAENVYYVEQALAAVREALILSGLPETYTYQQDVTALFLDNLDQLDPEIKALFALLDMEALGEMFGEYKTFTHEIPLADAIVFAVESYLYSYVKFNVEYAQLVYAVATVNPDAQIVLLGNYNAFENMIPDIEIRDIVIRFGDFLPSDLKENANEAVNGAFGVLENAVKAETVDAVFEAIETRIARVYDEIRNVQGEVSAFDFKEAISSLEIPDVELEALVGAENVGYAKTLINVIKYVLVESEAYDAILEKAPAKEDIFAWIAAFEEKIESGFAQLDASMEEAFGQIGMTLTEARGIFDVLSSYIAECKAQTLGVQSYLNAVYDTVAAYSITVKGTTFDLGEALGAPASAHALVYAFSMKNVIFVDISGADTVYGEGSAEDFLIRYILDKSVANVSDEGHAYIAEQVYGALNVVCLHRDADSDHVCDYCGEILSACADTDNDHKCDFCGKELSSCADTDKDHKCDLCGKEISACADTDKDHKCDLCGKELSVCADTDKDHKCDLCGKELSVCADADKDHKCDLCGSNVSECADDNHDHNCDLCGKKLSECQFGDWTVTKEATRKADGEEQRVCSVCGAVETRAVLFEGLSTGAIIAIVACSVVAAGGIGFAVWFFVFKKKVFAKK